MALIGGLTAAAYEARGLFAHGQAFQCLRGGALETAKLATGGYLASKDTSRLSAASTFRCGADVFSLVSRRHRLLPIQADLERRWSVEGQDLLLDLQDDFALAVWNDDRQDLHLARAPLGSFGLYYRYTRSSAAFATIAAALSENCAPNLDYLTAYIRPRGLIGERLTAFQNVHNVESGTVVKVSAGRAEVRRYWRPAPPTCGPDDKANRLRVALESAVDHALVGEERPAAHLSGGRDSAVVAATAALQLKSSGRTLVAFTSVPNTNTFLPSGAFVGDEGPAAAKVAALHPNIDHRRAVTSNFPLCTVLDQVNALLPGPHGTPVNLPWWTDIIKQASALGSALILTGAAGNMTVSAGGPWGIRDLLHTRDYRGWLKAISAAARVPQTSLLSLLDSSFGPSLPPGVYDLVKKVSGKAPHVWGRFVTGELGQHVRDLSASDMRQPELRQRLRYEMLENWNFSDPTSELLFGVSLRDPTAARNVVDASLALSLRELATPYDRRPTYEAAFKDRVPPEVLHKGAHGLQAADWATMIDPHDLRERFEVYAQSRSVAEYLDLQAVRQALARWPAPTQPCPEWEVYTLELLPAISLASFLHVHWPD